MNRLELLRDYTEKLATADSPGELRLLSAACLAMLEKLTKEEKGAEDLTLTSYTELWEKIISIGQELVDFKNAANDSRIRRLAQLSPAEKKELHSVEKIIDENLFTYYYQPIVNASDGEIYSYEALMRCSFDPRITPFIILNYAELTGRLNEIEKCTFINVLEQIEESPDRFFGKQVFINSIPNAKLSDEDFRHVSDLLARNASRTVVEMTEHSEFGEYELNEIKERYRSMNIRIAIDDYGTGYSNVKNLLRYTPNYVKIDRSLLSEIQSDAQKKHFVREIIDFCHANGILALAEGVETSEELRTVILLGTDLIQGYYTARPTSEIIEYIPSDIRSEIMRHYQEKLDGKAKHIYTAEGSERIMLDKLVAEGYDTIKLGNNANRGEIAVVGNSMLDTNIHIEVTDAFNGRLILDNAHLSNENARPCLYVGKECRLTLELVGSSQMAMGGIRVHRSAALAVEGKGDSSLRIILDSAAEYGIGNGLEKEHGRIEFRQGSTIEIQSDANKGVLIGSGRGGDIFVNSGRFKLKAGGANGLCVGAYYADTKLEVQNCEMNLHIYGADSVGIGSMDGNADVFIHSAGFKCVGSGERVVAVGSINGDSARVHIDCTNADISLQANKLTALGSMYGDSSVCVERSVFVLRSSGYDALVFGGLKGVQELELKNLDCTIEHTSGFEKLYFAERLDTIGGRFDVSLNGRKTDIFT